MLLPLRLTRMGARNLVAPRLGCKYLTRTQVRPKQVEVDLEADSGAKDEVVGNMSLLVCLKGEVVLLYRSLASA
jgi:hypothetical protein